jgi:hypothetical protein
MVTPHTIFSLMETSEVDAIPAPFSLFSSAFLKLMIGRYGYEDLVFNMYVEI